MTNEELPTAQRVETSVPIHATVVSATPINPSSPPEKYLMIWSLSRTVKVFAFIDIFFAFINTLYYNIFYIIGALGGFIGYYSAKTYTRQAAICYFTWNFIHLIFNLGIFVYVCFTQQYDGWYYFVSVVNILCLFWITKIVKHYSDVLSDISEDERIELLTRKPYIRRVVYW
jgi:hypothetical protein